MLGIAQRDSKEDEVSGERHSLEAPEQSSPQPACQEFHRGANSGSTWGWLLLGGVKKQDMIFGIGQLPTIISHLSSFNFSYHNMIETSAEIVPHQSSYPDFSSNIFSSFRVHLS